MSWVEITWDMEKSWIWEETISLNLYFHYPHHYYALLSTICKSDAIHTDKSANIHSIRPYNIVFLFLKVSYAESWTVYSYETKACRGDIFGIEFFLVLSVSFSYLIVILNIRYFVTAFYHTISFLGIFVMPPSHPSIHSFH